MLKIGDNDVEECTLEYFTNDRYKLLDILSHNQVKIKDNSYIPLSQQEIADISHFSKLKINKLLKELMDKQLVEAYQGKKGKYALADKAYKVLNLIQKTDI